MPVIVAINPTKDPDTGHSYLKTISEGFEADYLELTDLYDLPDDKPVIIFHPRQMSDNPQWLPPDKVEDFAKFDFPEDAYYIFNKDYSASIVNEIESKAPQLIKKARWVKIPTKSDKFSSIHGHQAATIVLWERYKRLGKATLDGNTW